LKPKFQQAFFIPLQFSFFLIQLCIFNYSVFEFTDSKFYFLLLMTSMLVFILFHVLFSSRISI
jgi:hypothetical protein